MSFSPTEQQVHIVDTYAGGDNLVVEAFAGTGKTSTLTLMAKRTPDERIIYIAYNKAIATEAKGKFPRNVECATAHSFAFRAVGKRYSHRLPPHGNRMTGRQTAAALKIFSPFPLDRDLGTFLSQPKQARLVMDTVKRFCYSADHEISRKHVPFLPGTEKAWHQLQDFVVPLARKVWADIQHVDGHFRFEHDHYLKMWQLSGPVLDADVMLFDEAQDANPATASVVLTQKNAQLVAVGDRNQAIYGWRGAEDAMQEWPADSRLFLTKSFRFGPAVAEEANKWLTLLGSEEKVVGFEQIDSKVGSLDQSDAVLCRTNAGCFSVALAAMEEGKKAAIVGGTNDIRMFAEAARELKAGQGTFHPELGAFQTWDQVQEYVESGEGGDIQVMVRLIDNYGVDQILQIAGTTVSEDKADLIVSTAHKAKGREWNSVKIGADFQAPDGDDIDAFENTHNRAEAMLAYVAITRAQHKLDADGLRWVNYFLPHDNKEIKA